MSDIDYKEKLSEEAYKVCRLAATERPFTGIYNNHWEVGTYLCACCEMPLYSSVAKFNSGCGWPSFFDSIKNHVKRLSDNSHNMSRIEIQCNACDSHLGHVFNDGPEPTGERHCVNSLSLIFQENT